jgi:hypothetical protein
MSGTSHSCHATVSLVDDQAGSKQKSAVVEQRPSVQHHRERRLEQDIAGVLPHVGAAGVRIQ